MKKITFLTIIILAAFTSCKKTLLNELPPNFTTADLLYSTGDGFEAGVNGLYALVAQERNGLNYTNGFGTIDLAATIYTAGTDNIGSGSNTGGLSTIIADWTKSTPTDSNLDKYFLWLYKIVSSSNAIITRAENPAVNWGSDATRKLRIVAEARTIRAWAYRSLTYLWGDVPLMTSEITGNNIVTDATREKVATIRAVMIEDLKYASQNLPWQPLKAGRMTRGVAETYLAETYLAVGKADSAFLWANDCITNGPYKLVTARYGANAAKPGSAFMDMFDPSNVNIGNGNTEALWVMQWERNAVGGGDNLMRHETTMRYPNAKYNSKSGFLTAIDERGGRGWSRQTITKKALLLYYASSDSAAGKLDQRGNEYALRKYYLVTAADGYTGTNTATNKPWAIGDTVWLATPIAQGNIKDPGKRALSGALNFNLLVDGNPNNNDWPYSLKFAFDDPGFPNTTESHEDEIYLRLAETILLRAEASGRLGNLTAAAADINLLRTRANAKQVTVANFGATLNSFLNYILDERSRELIVEETRRFTLLRMGGADYFYPRVSTWNTISKNLTLRDTLLPIPQSVIDANITTKMPQNPGW